MRKLGLAAALAATVAVSGCATYPNQYGYDPYYGNNGYYQPGYGNSQVGRAATGAADAGREEDVRGLIELAARPHSVLPVQARAEANAGGASSVSRAA